VLHRPVRYQSDDEDSARWEGFAFRPGDIVISTRSKSGTTWMQMVCALLIFQTPDLPAPLAELSPWLDWLITPRDQMLARLEAQAHRRFIKTHTPLDGLPLDPRATYIVVGRHPLDMAVSLYHQGSNINRDRVRELTGQSGPDADRPRPPRPSLHDWLVSWIEAEDEPGEHLDSLPGVMWHLSDAWRSARVPAARAPIPLAPIPLLPLARTRLCCWCTTTTCPPTLTVRCAVSLPFSASRSGPTSGRAWYGPRRLMRCGARAAAQAPDAAGILKDPTAFFRRGYSGAGRETLSLAELERYQARVAQLAPPDLLGWLHRDSILDPGWMEPARLGNWRVNYPGTGTP